ncbi:hypothetical protein [Bradyrhizobium sp.]|uniref:hypothetical protein n=1 Tax=Bradyrhizobium sp. TaxID=376 RepID=UPI002DFC90DE|nr:hypothetical protein [Bradyrhizobium sp.]
MTIKQLRILPPFAIGRLGSASEPMDNYSLDLDIDPGTETPLGYRQIKAQPTLIVDENSGEIESESTPATLEFKRAGKIRPVAPFLEVYAVTDTDELVPLTVDLLRANGLTLKNISWQVTVSNRKVVRRTQDHDDLVHAQTRQFSDHQSHTLKGKCKNFISPDAFVDFGSVRFIRPNDRFPEIRLRFTPAAGLIYGPDQTSEGLAAKDGDPDAAEQYQVPKARALYNREKSWYGLSAARNQTLPPSLFAIEPPAPSWLYDNRAISRGYLDDACDGFVEVQLTLPDRKTLAATARICAAPPAMAPDALFVRTLVDDLEQVIDGPEVAPAEAAEVTLARAQDIVRRAYETVRFMNVAVMNGNDFKGRSALSLDSMAQEEAADTQRPIRPIMPSGTVDTFAIMTLHQQAYGALRGGAAPWFLRMLRSPDEVADFTDRGRRKMPALMCGADNNYLALTWRQIDTIRKAASAPPVATSVAAPAAKNVLTPRNLSAQISYEAKGNPISSRPVTSVANCCPGLEVDFRAVWRRMFRGIELREYDNLVVNVDDDCDMVVDRLDDSKLKPSHLKGHRLLRVVLPAADGGKEVPLLMMTPIWGPASSDMEGKINLTTSFNPDGLAPVEWSNALARVLPRKGTRVRCDFSAKASERQQRLDEHPKNYVSFNCEVRPFFQDDTAVISNELAAAGELTQGLCSPWQNDFRECSCYYWASARPDYVNVELTATGLSAGDNWMQKQRSGSYVADDYADTRLMMYDDLFRDWETLLKFQVGGRDYPDPPSDAETGKKT